MPPSTPSTPAVGERPLLAITADGDAVAFDAGNDPVLLYDGVDPDDSSSLGGGVNTPERIAISADGATAYVGLCCAPPLGTLVTAHPPTPGTPGPSPTYGSVPTIDPSSTHLAYEADGVVTVVDLTTSTVQTTELRYRESELFIEIHDLLWIDDRQLLVLGQLENAWTRTVLDVTADGLDADTTHPFALTRDFADLKFAGTARPGEIAVHDVGTDRLLSAPLEDYGDLNEGRGSSLAVVDLPTPALSAWYTTPDHLVWVDTDHTLHDGALTIDGDFRWARR